MSRVRNITHKVLLNKQEEERKNKLLDLRAQNSVAEHYRYLLNEDYNKNRKLIKTQPLNSEAELKGVK